MPQAKKQQFVVTGKNDQHKVGDIVSLEVGDDGLPASELMRSRVKPYRGKVQATGEQSQDNTAAIEEGVTVRLKAMESDITKAKKAADDEAAKVVADAKAEAKKILDDASEKAEKIITDAHAATGKK